MSDSTSNDNNDDLSPTHEHIIAGVVILLFGLLYWFLNYPFQSSTAPTILSPATTIQTTEGKLLKPLKQGQPLVPATATVAASTASVMDTTLTTSSDAVLAINSENQSRDNISLNTKTIAQSEKIESPIVKMDVTEEKATLNTGIDEAIKNSSDVAPEQPPVSTAGNTADKIPDKANQAELPIVTANADKSKTTTDLAPEYTLPDGTAIKIASTGFEGELQQLFQRGELNRPLTYDQIYFDTASSKINAKSNHQIQITAALMNAYPKSNILLRGHTDNRGSASNNFQLSLARANSMGLALGALGIDTARIRVLGMGDSFPVASNNTEEGRKKNRRIEILLQ